MKEAFYYKKLKNKKVQCILCPRKCIIVDGNRGNCGVRINHEGKLFSLVFRLSDMGQKSRKEVRE